MLRKVLSVVYLTNGVLAAGLPWCSAWFGEGNCCLARCGLLVSAVECQWVAR